MTDLIFDVNFGFLPGRYMIHSHLHVFISYTDPNNYIHTNNDVYITGNDNNVVAFSFGLCFNYKQTSEVKARYAKYQNLQCLLERIFNV